MLIDGIEIRRLKHATFKIKINNTVIYFDPYKVPDNEEKADLILITHEHYDHLSLIDLNKIVKETTIIVTIPECQSAISRIANKIKNMILINPHENKNVDGFQIETIPAYNINKFRTRGIVFHPKDDGRVGFVLNINGKRIYHAGDTDLIPEMSLLKNIDIALLPVSGTYVMTAEEAAKAVEVIKPKIVIPMHFGEIAGTLDDANRFKSLVKNCNVIIL